MVRVEGTVKARHHKVSNNRNNKHPATQDHLDKHKQTIQPIIKNFGIMPLTMEKFMLGLPMVYMHHLRELHLRQESHYQLTLLTHPSKKERLNFKR
jgi:hypothetical protein